MKFIILCVALCVSLAAAAPPTPEQIKQMEGYMDECMKQNSITREEFAKVIASKPEKPSDVPENHKCAAHCFMMKNGYMDDSGKFLAEAAKAHADMTPDKEKTLKAIEMCKDKTAPNKCDAAFVVLKCMDDLHMKM